MQLRLASYNIHKGYSAGNSRYVLPAIREHLRHSGADLVFLQEVAGQHPPAVGGTEPLSFLAHRRWRHRLYGANARHRHGDHGNALLARWPLSMCTNLNLSTNRWEQRGLLHARCQLPGRALPLELCCTHLNLRQRCRRIQLQQIADYLHRRVPPQHPLILAGDFNDWRRRADDILAQLGLFEAHHRAHGGHARTFPAAMPWLQLDRIYLRGARVLGADSSRPLPRQALSDHALLWAEIALPPIG